GSHRPHGVMDGNGGVRIGARVEHDTSRLFPCLLNPGDEVTLVVGLSEIYLKAQFHAGLAAVASNVVQRLDAIDGRLALAEHVQVRAVKNKNRFQKCRPFPARKGSRNMEVLYSA